MKKYKTLKDHVYDYIAEQILEGNLIPSPENQRDCNFSRIICQQNPC